MVTFYVDREQRYIIGDKVYTQEEVDKMNQERVEKDRKAGYRDRMAGPLLRRNTALGAEQQRTPVFHAGFRFGKQQL